MRFDGGNMKPYFSVVMPTRNRAKTLRYAIQTALVQDFDDYEVVICDDASTDDTAEVVRSSGNSRIRYVRTPEPLGIGKIFEFGISQSRGTYTLLLGDDDGLLRNSLKILYGVIQESHAKVVRWHRAQYNWPGYPFENFKNVLIYTRPRFSACFVPSVEILTNAVKFVDCNDTPGLVNSAIHMDVFNQLRAKTGKLILSYAADTSSGFAIPCLVDEIYMLDKVLGVTGVSEFSHGTLLFKKENSEIEKEFLSLSQKVKDYNFKYWEKFGSSISAIILDSMHDVAMHFPGKIPLEQVDMIRASAQSIVEFSMVTNLSLRKQLIKNVYRVIHQSHGNIGVLKAMLQVTRGSLINYLNTPSMRSLSSLLRVVLNKPYSARHYFHGSKHGFSDIVGATEFLYNYIVHLD